MEECICSLIISTYNWPDALELCLKSVFAQKKLPSEILIADDGSAFETKSLVQRFQSMSPVPLYHIWHEDKGFRLAQIRNKAIAAAKGQYIIQIDGDQILHNHFVADHLSFAKPGTFVRASRAYMNENLSSRLTREKNIKVSLLTEGVSNKLSAMHVPLLWSLFEYKYKAKETFEIHGCNMAFWKRDMIMVNGYNEEFTGWGPEDKEFVARMLHSGVKKRFLKLGGITFHIYHPENSKSNLNSNESIFFETIALKRAFCEKGINQYF